MAGLLNSENLSGSTNLKISQGKLESSTKIGMLLKRDKSFFCIICKIRLCISEKTICFTVTPANSSSELMKRWESKILRIPYDDRICIREIDTIFNNGCGEENITFSFAKGKNMVLEFLSIHTSMHSSNTKRISRWFFDSYTDILDLFAHHCKGCNTIMKNNDLSISLDFPFDQSMNMFMIPWMNLCHNRLTLSRWSCKKRYFFDSRECHVEWSRNRRCREWKNINICFELIDFFFVHHAKLMLFINDKQTKVSIFNRFGENSMSSYHHMNITWFQSCYHSLCSLIRHHPSQKSDLDSKWRETFF